MREPSGHLGSHSTAVRFGKCDVCLWQGSDAGLNWFPIVWDTVDGALACLALDVNALKSRTGKQRSQPFWVGERERELENVPLRRKIAAGDIGKNAPHRYPICGRIDAHCSAAAGAKHTSKLHQVEGGVGKELQSELARHRIKDCP
jgi:hypothetical protein